jgi:hypothetical protein
MKRHSPPVVAINQTSRLGISAAIHPTIVPSGCEGSPSVAVPPGAPAPPPDDIGPTTPPRVGTGVGVKAGVVTDGDDVDGGSEAETEGDGVTVDVGTGVGEAVGAGGRGVGGGVAGTGVAVGLTTVTVEGLTLASVAVSTPDLDPATAPNE